MIENLLDPAHLPFTHEGTLAKRSDATELSFEVITDTLLDQSVRNAVCSKEVVLQTYSLQNPPFVVPDEDFVCIQGLVKKTAIPDQTSQYFTFHAPCICHI